jgi:hypothetical protein
VLDHWFGDTAYTPATDVEFAYFADASTEITGTGYARHTYLNDDTENSAPSGGQSVLLNDVDLGTAAAADWDEATIAVKFREDGTTELERCTLPEARQVADGENETIRGARVRSQLTAA